MWHGFWYGTKMIQPYLLWVKWHVILNLNPICNCLSALEEIDEYITPVLHF